MPDPKIDEQGFRNRFNERFFDPAFDTLRSEINAASRVAWEAYKGKRKAPRTQKAGADFADPNYDLSIEWLHARAAIEEACRQHEDKQRPSRVLLINGSPRNDHTCPGEMSKTFRLIEEARSVLIEDHFEADILDLSRLTAEYGRQIHPCKACFSTSPALCHWPCSCYPNHGLGQTNDWMNEIYPRGSPRTAS